MGTAIVLGVIFLAIFAGLAWIIRDHDRYFARRNARMGAILEALNTVSHCPACKGPSGATRCHVIDPSQPFQTAVCLSCGHIWAIPTPVNKP